MWQLSKYRPIPVQNKLFRYRTNSCIHHRCFYRILLCSTENKKLCYHICLSIDEHHHQPKSYGDNCHHCQHPSPTFSPCTQHDVKQPKHPPTSIANTTISATFHQPIPASATNSESRLQQQNSTYHPNNSQQWMARVATALTIHDSATHNGNPDNNTPNGLVHPLPPRSHYNWEQDTPSHSSRLIANNTSTNSHLNTMITC